jgi:hypothetical protein
MKTTKKTAAKKTPKTKAKAKTVKTAVKRGRKAAA